MMGMTVCSGIGAPEISAPWIDWRYQSEIEPFPCAVLKERFPRAENLGDMTKFEEWPNANVDVLCGGTPCQSFSVAGLRKGMADTRGNLTLTYLAIAGRYRPNWLVWENVPGVLSSNGGRDFGSFLGGLGKLGYGFAYRVLDAQFCRTRGFPRAIPQRRRRVFVVGYLGDWRRAAAVLFDGESLQGNPAPRRETGESAACGIGRGAIPSHDPACTLTARESKGALPEADLSTVVAFSSIDCGGDAQKEATPTLRKGGDGGFGQGMAVAYDPNQITSKANRSQPKPGIHHTLPASSHAPHIAFDLRGREGGAMPEGPHDTANIRAASGGSSRSYVASPHAVRRLTPVECERLMGFPDDFTRIPYRNKPADACPDGPRYKALGNSWAVNCGEWIFDRIKHVSQQAEATT